MEFTSERRVELPCAKPAYHIASEVAELSRQRKRESGAIDRATAGERRIFNVKRHAENDVRTIADQRAVRRIDNIRANDVERWSRLSMNSCVEGPATESGFDEPFSRWSRNVVSDCARKQVAHVERGVSSYRANGSVI